MPTHVTNYGGGNTSVRPVHDPVTGRTRCSTSRARGDLGTLRPEGLATLRVDRVRALEGVYRGPSTRTRWWRPSSTAAGAPAGRPSIDTAMHALVGAAHVDHLHPDAVIALAAADGEALTKECFGREVAWVPWRRPGFELGRQMAALAADNPGLRAWSSAATG